MGSGFVKSAPKSLHLFGELHHAIVFQASGNSHAAYDRRSAHAEIATGRGQLNSDLALVCRIPDSGNVSERRKSLKKWSQGVRLQIEALTQLADGLVVLLPQQDQDNELGIGEAQALEKRLVSPGKCVACRIDREAQKLLELQWAVAWRRPFIPRVFVGHPEDIYRARLNRKRLI